MDMTDREITKISRTAQRYLAKALQGVNLGTAEVELIHCVRHHPGINPGGACEMLHTDKAAIARRSANLVSKGYLRAERDENDRRCKKLYATSRAREVKQTMAGLEEDYYEWLLRDISSAEREIFLRVLHQLYEKSKIERKNGFATLLQENNR